MKLDNFKIRNAYFSLNLDDRKRHRYHKLYIRAKYKSSEEIDLQVLTLNDLL